jgi:uncharacterized membrane protein YedE/YeeE
MSAIGEVLKRERDSMYSQPVESFVAVSLATFQTSILVLLIVFAAYRAGELADVLAASSLLVGTLLFAFLWLTNFWCTLRAVREVEVQLLDQAPFSRMLLQGTKWGGINGVLVFLLPLAGTLVFFAGRAVIQGELEGLAGVLAFGATFGVLGAIVAFLVGMVIGFAFAALEVVLLACALAGIRMSRAQGRHVRVTRA